MCTDVEEGKGDPTEVAIVNALNEIGIYKEDLYEKKPRINDIPFDSTRKLMTTIHKREQGYRIITKGAVDILLNKCSSYYDNGKIINISESIKNKINNYNINMANNALRVIAVSFLDVDRLPNLDKTEENLIFVRINRNDRPSKRRG